MAASFGPDDESPVRRSAESCAGKFLDVSSAGHTDAAEAVAAERPQILVDLMAYTTGARYVASVAVQAVFDILTYANERLSLTDCFLINYVLNTLPYM